MILNRIKDIDEKLSQCDFYLVDYYASLTNEELVLKMDNLLKERDINLRLKKSTKGTDMVIMIVNLLIEKKGLIELYQSELKELS